MSITLTFPVPAAKHTKLRDTYANQYVKVNGKRYRYKRGRHGGIDIPAKDGSLLLACYDGVIVFPKWGSAYGNHLLIVNSNGTGFLYPHCRSIHVREGDRVTRGEFVGRVGSTGNASGPHVCFGVYRNYRDWYSDINPFRYLVSAQEK